MSLQAKESPPALTPKSFRRMVITRFAGLLIVLGLIFFLPAWTFNYLQAWVYMLIISVPMTFLIRYLYKHDPELLKRRLRMREKQKTQQLIQIMLWPLFLLTFLIPGFDHRLHWSHVPLTVTVISDMLVLVGYLIIALVLKTNSYASRIIEVAEGQRVITTGLYAFVRHPMYLGVFIFYIFSPLALGSYWAMIPALVIVPTLVVRIIGEERELLDQLKGYCEYMMKTRYRLIPGIW